MTHAADLLTRRAETLERLARWYRDHAERAQGPRASALRTTARELQEEAFRTALAAQGA